MFGNPDRQPPYLAAKTNTCEVAKPLVLIILQEPHKAADMVKIEL